MHVESVEYVNDGFVVGATKRSAMVICTSLMGHASVRPSVGVQSVKASDGATGKFVRCVC